MKKLSILLTVLAGCSFGSIKKAQSVPDRSRVPDCTQSNIGAGVDLVFSVASVAALVAEVNNNRMMLMFPTSVLGATTVASMLYGFEETATCRHQTEAAGQESHGSRDWLIPPLVVLTVGAAVAVISKSSGAGVPKHIDTEMCVIGQTPTALCRDGEYSCSSQCSGTCSHHDGIMIWNVMSAIGSTCGGE